MADEATAWGPALKALEARVAELESAREAQQKTHELSTARIVELEKLAEIVKKALPAEAPSRKGKWF